MRSSWKVMAAASLLLAGCSGGTGGTDASSGPVGGGAVITGSSAKVSGDVVSTWRRYPIDAEGVPGDSNELLVEKITDDTKLTGVVDGRDPWVLTGFYEDYYTTRLEVREASTGKVLRTLDVDRWCGGEGGEGRSCVLLDDKRLAHTPPLWYGSGVATVTVSSLETGKPILEFGPYDKLIQILGTDSPDHLILVLAGEMVGKGDLAKPGPATVLSLDMTTAKTVEIGRSPAQWWAYCAITQDTALGVAKDGDEWQLHAVGPAPIAESLVGADVGIPLGCSADGKHIYFSMVPEDGPQSLERISLADGKRSEVMEFTSPEEPASIIR